MIVWHSDEMDPTPAWWESWRLALALVLALAAYAVHAWDAQHAQQRLNDAPRVERLRAILDAGDR